MKHSSLSLIAAASLAFAGPAWGEDVATKYDRFKLWNDCLPMGLLIESLPKGASDIGLTKETLTTTVRSRLRAARLYNASGLEYLYLNVNVFGKAFNVDLGFRKVVKDVMSGELNHGTTWSTGSTGTHGRNPGFIRSTVSEHTDEFIDEYLRVNEEACKR